MAHVDAMKVVGVHNCALQKFDLSEMSFEQTLQLEVRFFPTTNKAKLTSDTDTVLQQSRTKSSTDKEKEKEVSGVKCCILHHLRSSIAVQASSAVKERSQVK